MIAQKCVTTIIKTTTFRPYVAISLEKSAWRLESAYSMSQSAQYSLFALGRRLDDLSRKEHLEASNSPLGILGADYSSSAPSVGSSAASTFERRLMLEAWISATVCLNGLPSTSSSTVRYLIFPSRLTSCPF